MINILYIGRHPEILETVVRLLNANEDWFGAGAETDETAMDLFQKINFNNTFAEKKTLDDSLFYNPILKVSESIFPVFEEWFAELKK